MRQVSHLLRRVWRAEQSASNFENQVEAGEQDRSSMADFVRILQAAQDQVTSRSPSVDPGRDLV
jgi:hypothetical protein